MRDSQGYKLFFLFFYLFVEVDGRELGHSRYRRRRILERGIESRGDVAQQGTDGGEVGEVDLKRIVMAWGMGAWGHVRMCA